MGWRAISVALVFGVLLSLGGNQLAPARAEVVSGAVVRCDILAAALDGDADNYTEFDEVEFTCQQPIPPTGAWSIESIATALGDQDGTFTAAHLAHLQASADNVLEESCTEAILNCAMVVLTFVDDENPITVDVPGQLATVENGPPDYVCISEGPGLQQDDDCVGGIADAPGDGIFLTRVLNQSGLPNQYYTTRIMQESVEIGFAIPINRPAGPGDYDNDGVPTVSDNCPQWPNAGQQNSDSAPLVLAGAPNDVTVPTADRDGDACDVDDDNDWLEDPYEPVFPMPVSPPGPCVPATAPTLVLNPDTDGDRVRDGAECVMAYNPASAASKPPGIPAGDTDRDGLADATESIVGSDPLDTDSDNDGIIDGIEVRGYQSRPTNHDTDGDGCEDDTEIASVNADRVVNSLDLLGVATRFASTTVAMMDINKDGIINSLDLVLVAKSFDPVPCG